MLEAIRRKVTGKEMVLGVLLLAFWCVLKFYIQYATDVYPFVAGLTILVSRFGKSKNINDLAPVRTTSAEELKKAYEKLNDIAHDFRAPLAGLKMACEQLACDPGNQELVSTLAKTFPNQVDRLFLLTTEISKYSKEHLKG